MLKKIYPSPQISVMELNTIDLLLLPVSGGQSTDEALAREADDDFDENHTSKIRHSTYNSWEEEDLSDDDF